MRGKDRRGGVVSQRVVRSIPLNLLDNAVNSIVHGMEHYRAGKNNTIEFKFAIQHIAHGAELLLKERLAREHALLIWEDVSKPGKRSVTWEAALLRLRAAGVDLTKYEQNLITLRDLRNRIEHFVVTLHEKEAAGAISGVLEFIFEFPVRHLGISLQTAFPDPRAWQELLKLKEFRDRAVDAAEAMQTSGNYYSLNHTCFICGEYFLVAGQDASTGDQGFCLLCGVEFELAWCEECSGLYEAELVEQSDVTGPYQDMCVFCIQEYQEKAAALRAHPKQDD